MQARDIVRVWLNTNQGPMMHKGVVVFLPRETIALVMWASTKDHAPLTRVSVAPTSSDAAPFKFTEQTHFYASHWVLAPVEFLRHLQGESAQLCPADLYARLRMMLENQVTRPPLGQ